MIISGKELSAKMKAEMAAQVATFPEKYGRVPHLVVILVGEIIVLVVFEVFLFAGCVFEAGIVFRRFLGKIGSPTVELLFVDLVDPYVSLIGHGAS